MLPVRERRVQCPGAVGDEVVEEGAFGALPARAVQLSHQQRVGDRDRVGSNADDWPVFLVPFYDLVVPAKLGVEVRQVVPGELAPGRARYMAEGCEVEPPNDEPI